MCFKMKEYNNPKAFMEKIRPEFDLRDAKIMEIHHDDYFGGSWVIEFKMDEKKYRFVWDNREMWLVLEIQGKNEKHLKEWNEIDIFRQQLSAKTVEDKQVKEQIIMKQLLLMLNKLKPTP